MAILISSHVASGSVAAGAGAIVVAIVARTTAAAVVARTTAVAIVARSDVIANIARWTVVVVWPASHFVMSAAMVVPAVAHTDMSVAAMVVASSSMVVAAGAVVCPAVSTPIVQIYGRTAKVEVGAHRIAGIDAKVPVASTPVQWAIEIGGGRKGSPLCV